MAEYRYFIKVHNGFPEHRKTADLSDRAFRVLVELWCLCSRNQTDGLVTTGQLPKKTTQKALTELVAAGYVSKHAGGVEMLQYLDHQMSKAQIADLAKVRADAGKRGGRSKANHLASATAKAKQTPSKSVAEVEVEVEVEKQPTTKLPSVAARVIKPDRFEDFWEVYPRREDKARAKAAWARAVRSADAQVIIDGAERYAVDPNREGAYTKHPTTWLNAESWLNGPLPDRRPPTSAGQAGMSTGTQRAMAAVSAAQQIKDARSQQLQIGAS